MLSIERKLKIAELVNRDGGIKTSELSNLFNVSEMTILRDLSSLEQEGVLERVYGGAVKTKNPANELPAIIRKHTNLAQKNLIAEKALKFISEGESIFLDASTTTLALAKKLSGTHIGITVITNGLDIINELKDNPLIKTICSGGELQTTTFSFIGPTSEDYLKNFFADKSFISASGLTLKSGITVENSIQASIKKIMITNSLQKIFLVDSSKFDNLALTRVCDLKEVDVIVTDKKPDEEYVRYFNEISIDLVF